MASPSSGASIGVRVPEPMVDLAPLVQHLAAAIQPWSTPHPNVPETSHSFITWDPGERALILDTNAALRRLWRTGKALEAMRSFLGDVEVPRTVARAHLGGVVKPGTEAQLRDSTRRLALAIDEEIDRAVEDGLDPSVLATAATTSVLGTLGRGLGVDLERPLPGPTRVVRTLIAPVAPSQEQRRDEVARIVDAVEEVESTRAAQIDRFFASVGPRLLDQGFPKRQVAAALQHHRARAERSGTQLDRFFDFLENEALSRVRMRVTSHIMEALGNAAEERLQAGVAGDWALLRAYCRRAVGLLASLGVADGQSLRLNLSAEFGQRAAFSLRDQVSAAGFVTCLPVWPEWRTQMFEEVSPPTSAMTGPSVTRELTYHFRVNGIVPETGKCSYETRLERIRDHWLLLRATAADSAPLPRRVNRSLAEFVFLWAVVPTGEDTPADADQALEDARRVAERLESDGKPALLEVAAELEARVEVVRRIARALVLLLRTRGTVLTRGFAGQRHTYYVNVLPDVVDWQRISAELDEPLAVSGQSSEAQVDFLRNISISRGDSLRSALLAIRVDVHLVEWSLRAVGEPTALATRRVLSDTLAPVVWRPQSARGTSDPRAERWLVSPRVEIRYDPRTVGWPEGKATEASGLNVLAATRSALAILVHLTLLRLARRIEGLAGRPPTFSVVRLQAQGAEAEHLSGDEGVYAAAQAVEVVLARDVAIRMQGIALASASPSHSEAHSVYKERGAFHAILAGFPLQIAQPKGERPMIGVVTFAARPCNEHPDLPGAQSRSLVLARAYLASPVDIPFVGYDVRPVRSRTEATEAVVGLPDTVADEVEKLYDAGCRHVILISHRFGQRRIGGGAAHPRLRDQGAILVGLAERHPDLTVYPLVRDVFTATRLRERRRAQEDAFEITRASDHVAGGRRSAFSSEAEAEQLRLRRRYEPVYSLATLRVVGGEAALSGKPQSGFCTYFLLRDAGMAPTEVRVRLESNLLGDESPVRPSLIAALRALHYLEAESALGGYVQPVLDPFDWLAPDRIGRVGEVVALPSSRRRRGSVILSLTALLDRTSRIAHALADEPTARGSPSDQRPEEAPRPGEESGR